MNATARHNQDKVNEISQLLIAASEGDVSALTTQLHAGTDVHVEDYDRRTAMHLAACEGHANAVRFLLTSVSPQDRQKLCNAKDRWGGTPLGEAISHGHSDCVKLLKKAGGAVGKTDHYKTELEKVVDGETETFVDADLVIFDAA